MRWRSAMFVLVLAVAGHISVTDARADTTVQDRVDSLHRMNYFVVTPNGPNDGGDFGPHTLSTCGARRMALAATAVAANFQ